MQRRSSASSDDSANLSVKKKTPRARSKAKSNRQPRDSRPATSSARNRVITNGQLNWQPSDTRESSDKNTAQISGDINVGNGTTTTSKLKSRHFRPQSPWALSLSTLVTSIVGISLLVSILYSSVHLQCDPKGCRMSWMSPSFIHFTDFDTEHTRLASKYSLYLYREQGIDYGQKFKGIPVLFIPGNAGSYKQVRSIASESARYFQEALNHNAVTTESGIRNLDFFTLDFNEDFTAFHGQTMLDQAEYVNEAIRYILSLYLDPQKTERDPDLPDPSSVIILGHSMGGIVARAAFVMPNFQSNSINTIITMSAPHARAPVTFDPLIVQVYQDINEHWRQAYSKSAIAENPLSSVTLVSIAGGGLDTVVPSDYASLESLVPETHGFTVFTSTIPNVWTSMDHQAITWCDQFRKVVVKSMYEIIDSHDKSQTKPRAKRMEVFRKALLTGLEGAFELVDSENSNDIVALSVKDDSEWLQDQERFVLPSLGFNRMPKAHFLPVPTPEPGAKRFTLLTSVDLNRWEEQNTLEILLCSTDPVENSQISATSSRELDLAGDSSTATHLACRSTTEDVVTLPASTRATKTPFFLENQQPIPPFSYLEYDVASLSKYQYVAVIDKAHVPTHGWVVAEVSNTADSHVIETTSITHLLASGLHFKLPANRPTAIDVRIPSIQSSLLTYRMEVGEQICGQKRELLRPLVRQYLTRPYESKYFVDAKSVEINLHGVSPFVPPPLNSRQNDDGLGLQFWTDPTCENDIAVKLSVDLMGSLGKLYMRYRTVFASFPQLVVGLVLRKQFRVYDNTGTFIPFSQSLGKCIRQSLPMLLLSMTFLSLSIGQSGSADYRTFWPWRNSQYMAEVGQNDLLVGTTDPFFWFLIPMIGIVCIGACVVLHYMALTLISLLGIAYGWVFAHRIPSDEKKTDLVTKAIQVQIFTPASSRRRLFATATLLFLVSTVIPYQFAYVIACLMQLYASIRASCAARENPSPANTNFNNYVHTIFLLMMWNLPINLPTVVVWVRNLAIRWFTPFSSYHNVLSILPFILLVENLSAGRMIPPVTSKLRHLTNILFFATAVYAAVYGVSYAYVLHYLVNVIAAWLVAIHSTSDSWTLSGVTSLFNVESPNPNSAKENKRP
ncbi:GPI inositol-deacylase [Xylariaceae sp. FL0255]|nr:GPI inositol-deacylase [Xylariaceae sp. FL0255]